MFSSQSTFNGRTWEGLLMQEKKTLGNMSLNVIVKVSFDFNLNSQWVWIKVSNHNFN